MLACWLFLLNRIRFGSSDLLQWISFSFCAQVVCHDLTPTTALAILGKCPYECTDRTLAPIQLCLRDRPSGLNQPLDEFSDPAALASLLGLCGKSKDLLQGRLLHAHLSRHGYDRNIFLENCLVEMYGNCGSVVDARAVFDNISKPNMFSWNILIKTYAQNGCLVDASNVFWIMPNRDVVSWTAMIAMFSQNGRSKDALHLFYQMKIAGIKPNKITFICTLDACANMIDFEKGQEIHADMVTTIVEQDVVVGTALINMYNKCGDLPCASWVFYRMPHRDVVTWNAMIAACTQNGYSEQALHLFRQMQCEGVKLTKITFVCALDSCASLGAIEEGQGIHAAIVDDCYDHEIAVGNTLINMYGKCKSLHNARMVFNEMPYQDVVSWNAMITAYAQNGQSKEALDTFCEMQLEGIKPDTITYLSALDACANLVALEEGKKIYVAIVDIGYEQNVAVCNALINMLGKCGSLSDAKSVFSRIHHQGVVSWTTIIAAFAQNGHGKEALDLFHVMQVEGIKPNEITFVCVLTACNHSGWVDDGRLFFNHMSSYSGIRQTGDHYVCMIDLLSRAGHLDEAEELIKMLPVEKVAVAWLCLLGACRIHGDLGRGERAANECSMWDPENAAPYVMLSNIYAAAGKWDDAANVRKALIVV